jgi:tetratricopeptide (TPR) repeat protein
MAWNESGPRGIELARKAVALDPSLAEAHAALGLGFEDEWKWEEAGVELSRALELDPRSPVAYFRKAVDLASRGRFAEAERTVEVAQVLDPSWSAPDGLRAEIYYYTHRWKDALELAQKIRKTWKNESLADNISWRTCVAQGQWQLARPFVAGGGDALSRAWLRSIDGDPSGAWRELLATRGSQHVPAFWLAGFAQTGLHDPNLAQKWLEQSMRDHEPDLVSLAIDPMFDPIRSTPAVESLLREMNLDVAAGAKRAMLQ